MRKIKNWLDERTGRVYPYFDKETFVLVVSWIFIFVFAIWIVLAT